jgi:hypothetical protein
MSQCGLKFRHVLGNTASTTVVDLGSNAKTPASRTDGTQTQAQSVWIKKEQVVRPFGTPPVLTGK